MRDIVDSGIRVVVLARQATWTAEPVLQPYAIVDYIPQSGTKNVASAEQVFHTFRSAMKVLMMTDQEIWDILKACQLTKTTSKCTVFFSYLLFPKIIFPLLFHTIFLFFLSSSPLSTAPYIYITFLVHCNENPVSVFPEKELRGLSPNIHIHVSVSDLYILGIGPCNFPAAEIGRPILGTY